VPLAAELAVVVVTDPTGAHVTYPTVETVQVDGICREILGPAPVDAEVRAEADGVARRVADVVGAVGVLAVELFWDGTRVLVNEVATRPHNSAHWTIEGAVTSQFANHLRAVAGLPLGRTDAVAPAVVCTNVLGAGHDPRTGLATALAVPGAAVHLYGKQARPGRKVGHVTVLGDDLTTARRRAAEAAAALGQPVPEVRR
jgi:5-(carboxyamino)imidazole ribonucleotide synthase